MNDVLVLNRNFYAVHVCTWQKAFCLLCKHHAYVIDDKFLRYNLDEWIELSKMMDEWGNGFVHTSTLRIAKPEVIALSLYDEMPKADVKYTRRNLIKHYNQKCCYCGNRFNDIKELNLDHVTPKSHGGKADWSNIVVTCKDCNSRKANRTPAEAGLKMHYKPEKPHWKPTYATRIGGMKIRDSWKKFIDKMYW